MKILVIGSGGREHALVWKLAQSPHIDRMWCAPGNGGIAQERLTRNNEPVTCVTIGAEDLPALLKFAQDNQPDLTVVGPDNPLALGIVDLFQQHRLRIWGPNQSAARFESSKVFAQQFMDRHGIPTAQSGSFNQLDPAKQYARSLQGRCAVKADGLALGKGVVICHNPAESDAALEQMMVSKTFGQAGTRVVIQELLEGMEISLHAICDGKSAKLFPTSQDHKRALDNDQGLNTGGMGTYSPATFVSPQELRELQELILNPWLKGCAAEKIDFRGIIYPGVMLTQTGPKVLEFNARFGDPETQVYLPRLKADLVELLNASVDGTLENLDLTWSEDAAVCVVMASAGYPGAYRKGEEIRGIRDAEQLPNTKVFHAGTVVQGQRVLTNGGRVLGVTAWADTLIQAREKAYEAAARINFSGAHYRRDIAAKGIR